MLALSLCYSSLKTNKVQDVITYKGQKLYPSELETILLSHPAVVDAAVVGSSRPHDSHGGNAGEVPCGFVVVAPSGPQKAPVVLGQQLVEFANSKLGRHKELEWDIEIIAIVPRNPAGKILRGELKKTALYN